MRMRERVTNKKRQEMDKKKFDAFRNEEVEMVWFAYPANFWATISLVVEKMDVVYQRSDGQKISDKTSFFCYRLLKDLQGMKLVGEMLLKRRKRSMYTYAWIIIHHTNKINLAHS